MHALLKQAIGAPLCRWKRSLPRVMIRGKEFAALGNRKAMGVYDAIIVGTGIQACLLG